MNLIIGLLAIAVIKNKYKVKFSNKDLDALLDNKETDQVLVFYELEDSQLHNIY